MANTKSAAKRARQSIKKNKQNRKRKELIKAAKRTLLEVAPSKAGSDTGDLLSNLQKAVDKAAKTKAIHPNRAARIKSRLAKKFSAKSS